MLYLYLWTWTAFALILFTRLHSDPKWTSLLAMVQMVFIWCLGFVTSKFLKLASGCTPRVWLVDLLGHSYHYLLNSDLAQHHSCIYTIYYLFLSNWNLERIHFEKWKYNCMSRSFIKSTLFLMQLSQLVIHQMGPISRWWII